MYHNHSDFQCGNRSHRPHAAWAHFKKHFGHAMSEKTGQDLKGDMGRKRPMRRKSVNIIETADAYLLRLYAAGLKKDLFTISVDEDILKIAYQPTEEASTDQFIYAEYRPTAFERSFKLNEKVMKDSISAAYTDGVLEITLPKNPDMHKPELVIEVQ